MGHGSGMVAKIPAGGVSPSTPPIPVLAIPLGGVLRLAVEGSMRARGILASNYAQPPDGDGVAQEIISPGADGLSTPSNSAPCMRDKVASRLGLFPESAEIGWSKTYSVLPAPHRRSLRPGLQLSRPWWDFDPTLPEDDRCQMYFMEQVADELMRRNGEDDSTWANLDMVMDESGNLGYASFRGSPPDLSGPAFPRTGDLIVAELCSWECEEAMEVLKQERFMDEQNAMASMRQTLEQDLGRIILGAIQGAKDRAARFAVPVGTEEVHVEMSLQPLNPHVGPNDPIVLSLLEQLSQAAETVRNRYRRDTSSHGTESPGRSGMIPNGDVSRPFDLTT